MGDRPTFFSFKTYSTAGCLTGLRNLSLFSIIVRQSDVFASGTFSAQRGFGKPTPSFFGNLYCLMLSLQPAMKRSKRSCRHTGRRPSMGHRDRHVCNPATRCVRNELSLRISARFNSLFSLGIYFLIAICCVIFNGPLQIPPPHALHCALSIQARARSHKRRP